MDIHDLKKMLGPDALKKNARLFVLDDKRQVMTGLSSNPLPAEMRAAPSRPTPGRMNKTEARFAALLDGWKLAGDILDYKFESVTLRLAPRTHYRTDFAVWLKDGRTRVYEVKGGYIRDDSWQKLKTVAVLYPHWEFVRAQWKDGVWTYVTLPNG